MGKDFRKKSDNEIVGGLLAEQIARCDGGRCLTEEEISQLVEGTAPPEQRDLWLSHLAGCDRCSEVFSLSRDLMASEKKNIIRWRRPLAWAASFLVVIASLYVFFNVGISPLEKMKDIPMEEELAQPESSDEFKSLDYTAEKSAAEPKKREEGELKANFKPEVRTRSKKSYPKTGPGDNKELKDLPMGREFNKLEDSKSGVVGEESPGVSSKTSPIKKDAVAPKQKKGPSLQVVQKRQPVEMADEESDRVVQQELEVQQVSEVERIVGGISPGRQCFTPHAVDGIMLNDAASGIGTEMLLLGKYPEFAEKVLPEIPEKIYSQYLYKKVKMEILMNKNGDVLRVCVTDEFPKINKPIAGALMKCRFIPVGKIFPVRFFVVVSLGPGGPEYKN